MHFFFFLWLVSALFTAEIQIGGKILKVEIADTPETQAKGLMGRDQLPEGHGMLFVYESPEYLVFWMKNTRIPLSIAFFDANRTVLNILDMDPPQKGGQLLRYYSSAPALYALEVPQGWFKKHKIGQGAKFSFLNLDDPL